MFRSNLHDLLSKNLNLHLLIHDYTWSRNDTKWEKNILTSFHDEYNFDKKYFESNIAMEKRTKK